MARRISRFVRKAPSTVVKVTGSELSAVEGKSSWVVFSVVALPLFIVYLATSTYSRPYNIDAFTNVLTAWEIAQDGSPFLDEHEHLADPQYLGNVGWVEQSPSGAISQYPPGAALHAVPFYLLWPEEPGTATVTGGNREAPPVDIIVPPLAPAAIASSLVVAVAMGVLAVSLVRLVPLHVALVGAYVVGLGTSAWSVAANQLWQHGPGMLWIAVGGLLSQQHPWWGGGAYGVAILIRPPTALIAAANGLTQAVVRRSIRPALAIGVASAAGLAAVILYNAWVFDNPSITGGYGDAFTEKAIDTDVGAYATNVWRALVDPTRGLLIWSPWLAPLALGLREAWRRAPAWARGAGLGGLLYLLVQLKANRFSGGDGFPTYRYPLEAIAAATPLLAISYHRWVRPRWLAQRAFVLLAGLALIAQLLYAVGT